MGTKRNTDMSENTDVIKIVSATASEEIAAEADQEAVAAVKSKKSRVRSAKYTTARSQVDKTKHYDPFAAFELIKRLSYSKFDGTIVAHVVVREVGMSIDLSLPHSTGKALTVVIASDEVLAEIEAGNIAFDVLVSSKEFMPKLTKYARVLGPKGLMPNPKNGTLTSNPEVAKKQLEAGKMNIKTEKKAPLMHIMLGKVSMETKDLVENMNALLEALKNKVVKMSIAATMSPSVKVDVSAAKSN
jgi:large subunit ribosomal protein L1